MQLTAEQIQAKLIQFIRDKFQSPEQRQVLLSLMIGEVQLQMMKETFNPVKIESARDVILEELMTIDLPSIDTGNKK